VAALGGVILVAMAAMTVTSVIGAAFFARPILGDVELVQLGTAVCVALFLPYTQSAAATSSSTSSPRTLAAGDGR
jgi:hypothetical protein